MSEQEYPQQIRFSFNISLFSAIARSLGVILVLAVLILLGDLVGPGKLFIPLISLILIIFVGLNLLGYLELSMCIPQPGGAYQLVQTCEEGNWLAFLTGWALFIAGLIAAGILTQGFAKQASNLINELAGTSFPQYPFGIGLLVLTAGYKLLPYRRKGNGTVLVYILAGILLICLIAFPRVQPHFAGQSSADWRAPFNILLIAFIGLEITTGLQNEIVDRRKNVPRALFVSTILAGFVIALVGFILSGLFSGETNPTLLDPLNMLAALIAGRWSQVSLAILIIIAIPLALNQVFSLLIRLLYTMSKDGFWPQFLTKINRRGGSPVYLVILLTALILITFAFPLPDLARVGSLFYLIVLMGVNFSLSRREQMVSSFKLPIHPWIPALVLVFDFLLILSWASYLPVTAVLIAVGFILFFFYGRHRSIRAKEGITVFKTPIKEEPAKQNRRILVPIANPETAETLLRLAGTLVRAEGGKVIALRVVTVPSQVPLAEGRIKAEADRMLLDLAIDQATKEEFRVQTMTRVSRSVSDGILDTAREEDVDQILVGWSGGETRSVARSMGPVLDPIVKDAPCDVLVVKGHNWKDIQTILVPTAGGPNAPIGAQLASTLALSTDAKVTGLYVQVGRASPTRMAENRQTIERTFEGLEFNQTPEKKVTLANNVLEGILKEAEDYDLVIVGASEQGFIDQFAFGSIPQRIAGQAPHASVMVKGFSGAPEFLFRKILRSIFNLFPTLTTEEQLSVREDLIDDAQPGSDYFVLIVLSSIIATLGLLLNSPAVVIGAMLVAPLMSPILGFSLGIVLGEVRLIRTSLESVFKGVMATIIVSILVGLLSPLKDMTPEILARTQPTLLDLFIALASGMAGAYALSRKDVSAALPGVAIAAALAPPLSVVGLGFAFGNISAAGGALLLFVTNIITISLAGVLIFTLLGIHPLNLQPEIKKRVRRGITGMAFLVILITIPLAILMNGIIKKSRELQTIEKILYESGHLADISLLDVDRTISEGEMLISATVRSDDMLDQIIVNDLAASLEEELNQPLILEIITLPIIRSE